MDQPNISASVTSIWTKFFIELMVLVLTGIVAASTVFLRKKIVGSLASFMELFFKWRIYSDKNPQKAEVMRDIRVHDILADLRNQTKSDRAYIFQFHNGSIFSSKNQMWKLTRTHESVNPGIRPCIGDLQGILSSSVHELLLPLWESDINGRNGIIKLSPEMCNCKDKCNFPHGVYFYDINKIDEGYTKGLLLSHAVKYMVITPLLDLDLNRIGFLGLDYCWQDANIEEIKKNSNSVCKTASIISYEIKKKI